jgi:hypothetical protein
VIEEETGTPLEIKAPSPHDVKGAPQAAAAASVSGAGGDARLIARDERKNPLISTFEWTSDAVQRVLRVPAGFMRTQTQERIEELARARAATAIDLALVEEGIEIGKRMMAEMIANYPSPGQNSKAASAVRDASAEGNGSGYLNEVRPLREA